MPGGERTGHPYRLQDLEQFPALDTGLEPLQVNHDVGGVLLVTGNKDGRVAGLDRGSRGGDDESVGGVISDRQEQAGMTGLEQ